MTNIVILVGRIGNDPEVRSTQSGSRVATISVATSSPKRENGTVAKDENGYTVQDTEWHRVTLFGKQAEFADKYLRKGALVTVRGSLHNSSWTDAKGEKRYSTEVRCDQIDALARPPER